MKLNKSIAEMIVKRTMQIIPNSVNVMDENGVIIASGDMNRLNQRHTGALITLRYNQITEVDQDLARSWNYEAKEGINLPLHYLGTTVGVVGISGNPDKVRQYAQLVKMAAELIMEQSFKLEQESWQRRYREEFIRSLLKGELNEIQIKEQLEFFKLDLAHSLVVILIKITHSSAEKLQILLAYLEHHHSEMLCAIVGVDRIAVVAQSDKVKVLHKKALGDFSQLKISIKMSVGLAIQVLSHIAYSYQTACYALDYAEKQQSKKQLIHFNDFKLPTLLYEFSQSWQAQTLFLPFQKLLEQDVKKNLVQSLKQYFLSNCDLFHASQRLFVHPNTLRYRLAKIEEITALSFNKIEDKCILYLALMLEKDL